MNRAGRRTDRWNGSPHNGIITANTTGTMKTIDRNGKIAVPGATFKGINDVIKHAVSSKAKNGVYVGEDSMAYPCFDDEDYANENRRFWNFVFADNTTLEDIIIQAGGLLESASTVKVDVSRRVKDPSSTVPTDTISRIYSFSIKDGFVIDGEPGFILAPYDRVMVRRSPGYSAQRQVSVSGEVVFAGSYTLTHKNQRISELVADAGGVTDWAYVKGARLVRRINSDERTRMDAVLETMSRGRDSIDVTKLDMGEVYYVGIDLSDALANPGGDTDLVLREGDELQIPEYNNTVRISGNVMYPNTVVYDGDMRVKDFVEMAGGYGFRSKKNKAYVIYMNGTVAKAGRNMKAVVQPGCEIVVPAKGRNPEALQNILSIATTSASLATMIATIGNIIK